MNYTSQNPITVQGNKSVLPPATCGWTSKKWVCTGVYTVHRSRHIVL